MKKLFSIIALAFALTISAFAQTANTSQFSASFNGPVAVRTYSNPTNNNTEYFSHDSRGVYQFVTVRTIDGDIAVNTASSDFYMNNERFGGVVSNVDHGTYQGHPYTYAFFDKAPDGNGGQQSERIRYIIVNSRTVIFIFQIAPESVEDRDAWVTFEATLNIK